MSYGIAQAVAWMPNWYGYSHTNQAPISVGCGGKRLRPMLVLPMSASPATSNSPASRAAVLLPSSDRAGATHAVTHRAVA